MGRPRGRGHPAGRGNGRCSVRSLPPTRGTCDDRPPACPAVDWDVTEGGVTVGAVPDTPRPTWRLLLVSTTLALIAAAGTVVLLSDGDGGGDDETEPSSVVTLVPSEEVPTFDEASYTTWDGEEVPLASVRGTPTVVNFFASTCIPCITEMPAFEEVYQELGAADAPVRFLGIAISTDRSDDAQELVDTTGVTYPTAQDKDSSVASALDVTLLPTTVLLDADGEVVRTSSGELSAEELRTLLAEDLGVEP